MTMKLLTVIGARPQFIKAAAVSAGIRRSKGAVNEVLVHTGQHFDANMSHIFFDQMGIPEPGYHLEVHSLSHGAMTGIMMTRLEEVIVKEKPDRVMVYGDTNSTLAGAITARKLNIPLAHVEAGLRSFDMSMPEEVNRILTDRISDLLFCPTIKAKENLMKEGFENFNARIAVTGDVMLDAALHFADKAKRPDADFPDDFILVTFHRQSNTDIEKNLRSIMDALMEISMKYHIVCPLHPRTKAALDRAGIKWPDNRITIIDPVGYLESIWLIKNSKMVITDSGGLQKEAYFMGRCCLTLRDETEWTELVDAGVNITAGVEKSAILNAYDTLIQKHFSPDLSIYGDGKASSAIVDLLINKT